MSHRWQQARREALPLPADERATVAAELLPSLEDRPADDPVGVEATWAAEVEGCALRALAGTRPANRGEGCATRSGRSSLGRWVMAARLFHQTEGNSGGVLGD